MSIMYAIDTLAYAKKLKKAGYPAEQAEALAEAQGDVFRDMLQSTLANKDDLKHIENKVDDLEVRMDAKIDALEVKLENKIDAMDTNIRADFHNEMQRLTIRLGSMMAAGVFVLAAMNFFK